MDDVEVILWLSPRPSLAAVAVLIQPVLRRASKGRTPPWKIGGSGVDTMATSTLSAYSAVFSYPVKNPDTVSYIATWTNLGPLTTVFTPPASCNTPAATNLFIQGRTTWAHDCSWTPASDTPRSDCYPSYTAPTSLAAVGEDSLWLPGDQKFYYSPGYFCPAGWQTATTMTTPAPATLGIWDEAQRPLGLLDATGTQILCCPSAWTLGGLAQCYSRVEASTTLAVCREQTRSFNHTNRAPPTSTTSSTMVAYTTPAVLLYHDSAQSQGAPTNTISIVVGVVVPVVVLLAVFVGALFWFRRRKRRQQARMVEHSTFLTKEHNEVRQPVVFDNGNTRHDNDAFAKPELDGSDPSRQLLAQTKPELPGSYPLPRGTETSELADTSIDSPTARDENSRNTQT